MSLGGKHPLWFALAVGACLLAGCSLNPQVRKKKYVDKGNSYFQQGKYREAVIEYENAIQIDSNFGDAHFGLAQSLLREGDWPHAYQELTKTVELEPTNWNAQLALGDLLLAGHRFLDARSRAETILAGDPQNARAQVLLSGADDALGQSPQAIVEAQQ